ncbi:hypothetical protein M8C21_005194 [Ambrosia artemisiifolia]|uniref:Uncharacterized protein n=1 Tax=Ambrosia artemisiifolia TaxID=4212 RepID=A0AAD5C5L3_AMBAR|nr:hypothetical protein M8C21_005194 [Ambrosia artemisiifolia]
MEVVGIEAAFFVLQGMINEICLREGLGDGGSPTRAAVAPRCYGDGDGVDFDGGVIVVPLTVERLLNSPIRVHRQLTGFWQSVSKDLSDPVRSHKIWILDKDVSPFFRKAVQFYDELAKQMVNQGHVLDSWTFLLLPLLRKDQLNVCCAQCIVIEDALAGVQAAHAAQMRCIAVTTTLFEGTLKEAKPSLIRKNIGNVSLEDILAGGSSYSSM